MSDPAKMRWRRRSAWHGIAAPGRYGRANGQPGVHVMTRDGLSLATIVGRHDRAPDLIDRLAALVDAPPPLAPMLAHGPKGDLVWAGLHQWLLVTEDEDLFSQAAARLQGLAAVSDQSDARAVLRLRGLKARDALAKGCLVDLHSRAFKPGDAAVTAIAHIGVHLWQIDDAPTYDLAVLRSVAASFWSWLAASAAEHGCEVSEAGGWR